MKKSINPYLIIGIFFIPIFMLSCSNHAESKNAVELNSSDFAKEEQSSGVTSANSIDQEFKKENDQVSKLKKKLIRTGNLVLESKHIEKSKNRLDQALKSLGGYYDNEQFSKSNYEFRYSLKVRVPAKNFDNILQVIQGGDDEIVSKNIQTDDVSGEYVDLETRLKSKRAYLQRYEAFLSKAQTMEELLQIQEQIRELIEEIESQEARLTFLDDQVGYSTLDIELYKVISNTPIANTPGFSENAQNAFSKGWIGVVSIVLSLLSIWPLLLILIPAGIFGYRKLKNQKN